MREIASCAARTRSLPQLQRSVPSFLPLMFRTRRNSSRAPCPYAPITRGGGLQSFVWDEDMTASSPPHQTIDLRDTLDAHVDLFREIRSGEGRRTLWRGLRNGLLIDTLECSSHCHGSGYQSHPRFGGGLRSSSPSPLSPAARDGSLPTCPGDVFPSSPPPNRTAIDQAIAPRAKTKTQNRFFMAIMAEGEEGRIGSRSASGGPARTRAGRWNEGPPG